MNIKRILAISKKEFIHVRRDRRSLILSLVIPIMLIILFGYALSLDIKDIPTTILDLDNGRYSREFISSFSQSGYFTINDYVYSRKKLEENIDSGKSMVAIIIPPDFSKNIASGNSAKIQTIIDGSGANKASIANGYIEKVIQYISYLVPARYFIIILRGIFMKGSGFFILSMEVLYLAIFAFIVFIIANLKFIKKLT